MYDEDCFVYFLWGIPLEKLPKGFDIHSTELELFQAGAVEDDASNGYLGLRITAELSGLNEITNESESFEGYEKTRTRCLKEFRKCGIEIPIGLYLIQGL